MHDVGIDVACCCRLRRNGVMPILCFWSGWSDLRVLLIILEIFFEKMPSAVIFIKNTFISSTFRYDGLCL